MTRGLLKRERDPAYKRLMRNMGYQDGLANRQAKFSDAEYQMSWRRGREAREALMRP